jgi:hypothetical protein
MNRSPHIARPRWSTGTESRSNSMMSSVVTSAGGICREIK